MSRGAPKYKNHVTTAIDAAKLSIESFNKISGLLPTQQAIVANCLSWELLGKGFLMRKGYNIYNSDGTTIGAEKVINLLQHKYQAINSEENKTLQQITSLRNEALHGILPNIDHEIITHLLYFSCKTFHGFLKQHFKSYYKDFDKNFLAISFRDYTFYSDKVSKLLAKAKEFNNDRNRLLYLLDRGVDFAGSPRKKAMIKYDSWKDKIRKLPRKSRVSRHLSIYRYLNKQEDIRLIPVHVARGYKPEVQLTKTSNPLAPVIVKKSDPNVDFPHLTSDVASKLGKSLSFVAKTARKLKIIDNDIYCSRIRTSRSGMGVPKYNDKALNFIKDYLQKHSDFNPFR